MLSRAQHDGITVRRLRYFSRTAMRRRGYDELVNFTVPVISRDHSRPLKNVHTPSLLIKPSFATITNGLQLTAAVPRRK
jgi:hypothetical protein